jgi:hypothetical protein
MSERMSLVAQRFFINSEHKQAAFAAVTGGELELIADYQRLEDVLSASGWPVDLDGVGNIVGIRFDEEAFSGMERRFFAGLAPFVQAGSVILCLVDGSDPILWSFNGNSVIQERGEAVASTIAALLSHTVEQPGDQHTLAGRLEARFNAYRAAIVTLVENYHDMPQAYTDEDPETRADRLYRSGDEEAALLSEIRAQEERIKLAQRDDSAY